MIVWLIYMASLVYMELVYHFGCFGFTGGKVLLPLALLAVISAAQSVIVAFLKGKGQKIVFWVFLALETLLFCIQSVYYTIFKQPLQIRAAAYGGGDALTSYWRETLMGMVKSLPMLLLLLVPCLVLCICVRKKKWKVTPQKGIQRIRVCFSLGVSLLALFVILSVGKYLDADYYSEYKEFYAPLSVAKKMGVVTMVQRDVFFEIETLLEEKVEWNRAEASETEFVLSTPAPAQEVLPAVSTQVSGGEDASQVRESGDEEADTAPETYTEPKIYAYELDLEALAEACAGEKQKEWLAQYIVSQVPTTENEYTGMFEGYNLIFLTAEGFSTYAIDPQLTPTLYKLANSGFVFQNYYVPLWQTSTSDGEYINCTGLIPDGQFSMRKSGSNNMAYTLAKFFNGDGVQSLAYHNNTLSYYDRYVTHSNLGYFFKASKLGTCSNQEWGDHIFEMENPDRWPSSDLEMMQATLPEYISQDRFHVYYMTISGHMYYSFTGNSMSAKNKDAVKDLDMSENARAYIACNIELDKALEYLLTQLEEAGKLENTVICLSADHYPYAMSEEEYEELAGKDLSEDMDKYRNTLILWNCGMEETVVVDKVCGSMDLVPTLLNLFGYAFDSRMYAGRDIFSDTEGLVIFNDRSFVSDTVCYNTLDGTTTWKTQLTEEEKQEYLTRMKQEVKNRYQFSAYILQEDFYDIIEQCRVVGQ